MNKSEFLDALRNALNGYPAEEVDRSVAYYSEMIDDRTENGMTETDAVSSLGSVEEIAKKIRDEVPLLVMVKDRARSSYEKQKQKTGGSAFPWILLAIVLCPVWIPLAIGALGGVIGLIAGAFGIVIALWGTFAGFVLAVVAGIVMLVCAAVAGAPMEILFSVGCILVCVGLALLAFWVAFGIGKAVILAIRAIWRGIRRGLTKTV